MSKLLIISTSFQRGGAGKVARGIAEAASQGGWDVLCAYSSRFASPLPDGCRGYKIGSVAAEYAQAGLAYLSDSQGYWSTGATRRLIAEIERFAPDVINLHNVHGYYLNVPLLLDFLRSYGTPVVWTIHDFWPLTGRCAFPEAVGCEQWKAGCTSCPSLANYPRALIDRSRQHQAHKMQMFCQLPSLQFVTMSQTMARNIKFSPLGRYPVEIIPNGVDINVFVPGTYHTPRSILAVASEWTHEKGYEDMLQLRQLLPPDYQIVMAGVNSRQKRELSALGIVGVEHTESQAELAEYYRRAEVFVTPSRADNFPTVLLEALACGTPCVGYDTGAISEIITSHCGTVVPRSHVHALADSILRICTAGKSNFNIPCRHRAATCYSAELSHKKYLELFRKFMICKNL